MIARLKMRRRVFSTSHNYRTAAFGKVLSCETRDEGRAPVVHAEVDAGVAFEQVRVEGGGGDDPALEFSPRPV
jgi:hypothetical protein